MLILDRKKLKYGIILINLHYTARDTSAYLKVQYKEMREQTSYYFDQGLALASHTYDAIHTLFSPIEWGFKKCFPRKYAKAASFAQKHWDADQSRAIQCVAMGIFAAVAEGLRCSAGYWALPAAAIGLGSALMGTRYIQKRMEIVKVEPKEEAPLSDQSDSYSLRRLIEEKNNEGCFDFLPARLKDAMLQRLLPGQVEANSHNVIGTAKQQFLTECINALPTAAKGALLMGFCVNHRITQAQQKMQNTFKERVKDDLTEINNKDSFAGSMVYDFFRSTERGIERLFPTFYQSKRAYFAHLGSDELQNNETARAQMIIAGAFFATMTLLSLTHLTLSTRFVISLYYGIGAAAYADMRIPEIHNAATVVIAEEVAAFDPEEAMEKVSNFSLNEWAQDKLASLKVTCVTETYGGFGC